MSQRFRFQREMKRAKIKEDGEKQQNAFRVSSVWVLMQFCKEVQENHDPSSVFSNLHFLSTSRFTFTSIL